MVIRSWTIGFLCLATLASLASSSRSAWAVVCERDLPGRKVTPAGKVSRIAEHIAKNLTYYGEFGLEAQSAPTALRVVQDCRSDASLSQSYFQGLTLRYRVRVASETSPARTYYCVARIKRLRGFDTQRHLWSRWLPAGVACSLKATYLEPRKRSEPAIAYGADEGSEPLRRAHGIDDVTDPLFSERPGTWGLGDDQVDDPYTGGPSSRDERRGFDDWGGDELLH